MLNSLARSRFCNVRISKPFWICVASKVSKMWLRHRKNGTHWISGKFPNSISQKHFAYIAKLQNLEISIPFVDWVRRRIRAFVHIPYGCFSNSLDSVARLVSFIWFTCGALIHWMFGCVRVSRTANYTIFSVKVIPCQIWLFVLCSLSSAKQIHALTIGTGNLARTSRFLARIRDQSSRFTEFFFSENRRIGLEHTFFSVNWKNCCSNSTDINLRLSCLKYTRNFEEGNGFDMFARNSHFFLYLLRTLSTVTFHPEMPRTVRYNHSLSFEC